MFKMPEEIKPNFKASDKDWVKIWFSTDPSQFMKKEMSDQFLELAIFNEGKRFVLVYSSSILDKQGKRQLQEMQDSIPELQDQISYLDIDSKEFISALKDYEKELYSCAKAELASLSTGGNAAAASDIVRILSPCFTQGHYTDFDVPLDFSEFPSSPEGERSIVNSVLIPMRGGKYCNDVIVVAKSATEEQLAFITAIQRKIVTTYQGDGLEKISNNISHKIALGAPEEVEQLKQMIKTANTTGTNPNPLIALRSAIKTKLNTSSSPASSAFWQQAYMRSVMNTTGPGVHEQVHKRDSQAAAHVAPLGEFGFIARSQVNGQANSSSWVPARPTSFPLKAECDPQKIAHDMRQAFQEMKAQPPEAKYSGPT
ncbi:hypothetical protein FQU71_10010 [Legionella longbeachae]|nr:hypothetical protein FQU71_10010 [Legionella longbeachae]